MQPAIKDYDYIISGAGCSGISLLLRILQEPMLRNKTILIIDNDTKELNDRTWCFWETGYGFLENLVLHRWNNLTLYTDKTKLPLAIAPYAYKMIRGIDMYNYSRNVTLKRTKIVWHKANITAIGNTEDRAFVIAEGIEYTAQYVFNSILFEEEKKSFEKANCYKLLQHFKGWVIETKEPIFNSDEATFMDFRVSQDKGAAFVYVLPTSPTKALVEYTFFNEQLLDKNAYDSLLKEYLSTYLKQTDYMILETEYGVIPMTNYHFKNHEGNVINIGTAGGWTKASSGFTFQFIQKNAKTIADSLVAEESPVIKKGFLQKRYSLYDATLLNVLANKKMEARDVFYKLFSKQKATSILRFLDNESNLIEDLKILSSVPTAIFLPAALQEIFSSGKKEK